MTHVCFSENEWKLAQSKIQRSDLPLNLILMLHIAHVLQLSLWWSSLNKKLQRSLKPTHVCIMMKLELQ